jgi:hypothetical protein
MVELAEKDKVNSSQIKAEKKEFLDNKASVFVSEGSSKAKLEKEQLTKREQYPIESVYLDKRGVKIKKCIFTTLETSKICYT